MYITFILYSCSIPFQPETDIKIKIAEKKQQIFRSNIEQVHQNNMSTIALIISKISAMKGKADILEYCFIEKSFCGIQQWCAFQPSWCLTNPINMIL